MESLLYDFSWDAFIDQVNMLPSIILAVTAISIVWLGLWLLAQYIGLYVLFGGLRFLRLKKRRMCASLRAFVLGLLPARQSARQDT